MLTRQEIKYKESLEVTFKPGHVKEQQKRWGQMHRARPQMKVFPEQATSSASAGPLGHSLTLSPAKSGRRRRWMLMSAGVTDGTIMKAHPSGHGKTTCPVS